MINPDLSHVYSSILHKTIKCRKVGGNICMLHEPCGIIMSPVLYIRLILTSDSCDHSDTREWREAIIIRSAQTVK